MEFWETFTTIANRPVSLTYDLIYDGRKFLPFSMVTETIYDISLKIQMNLMRINFQE